MPSPHLLTLRRATPTSSYATARLQRCSGWAGQVATVYRGVVRVNSRCLDSAAGASEPGTAVIAAGCSGAASQLWTAGGDGTLRHRADGLCLADPDGVLTAGTALDLENCATASASHWYLP